MSRKVNITAPANAVALFKFRWPTGDSCFPRFYIRSTNTTLDTQGGYFVELNRDGGFWQLGYSDGSYGGGYLGSSQTKTFTSNVWYWVRFGVVGTALKGKVWDDGSGEPGTWDSEVTDGTLTLAASGCGLTVGPGANLAKFEIDDFVLSDAFPVLTDLDSAPTITVTRTAAIANSRPLDGTPALTVGTSAARVNSRLLAGTPTITVGGTAAIANSRPLDTAPVITVGATAVLDVSSASVVGLDSMTTLTVGTVGTIGNSRPLDSTPALVIARSAAMTLDLPLAADMPLTVGRTGAMTLTGVLAAVPVLTVDRTAVIGNARPLDTVMGLTFAARLRKWMLRSFLPVRSTTPLRVRIAARLSVTAPATAHGASVA